LALPAASGHAWWLKDSVFYGENQHRQKIGKTFSHSVHAEINTVYKRLRQKNIYDINQKTSMCDGDIYIVRLMNIEDGKCDLFDYLLGISKPCERCQSFLHRHRVKKIKYTDIIDGINVLCEMRAV
jgi:hypothetical protein